LRRLIVLTALLGGVLFVAPSPAQAGVVETGSVTIVNAVAYDAPQDFPLTVCIDGELIEAEVSTETTLDPIDLEPGTYNFEFFQGGDCGGSEIDREVTVAAGDNITVMAYWGDEGQDIAVFDNDVSCVDDGFTRVTFRHGASDAPADWFITPDGGSPEEVLSDVAAGEQAVASDLVAQAYSASELREAGTDFVLLDTGEPGDLTTTTAYYLYFFGGNDGETGYFTSSVEVEACEDPTTTTTAPATTTTAAAAAVVTPRFTG
jgi:hypothetical protein